VIIDISSGIVVAIILAQGATECLPLEKRALVSACLCGYRPVIAGGGGTVAESRGRGQVEMERIKSGRIKTAITTAPRLSDLYSRTRQTHCQQRCREVHVTRRVYPARLPATNKRDRVFTN
jgi:hypothetical protein